MGAMSIRFEMNANRLDAKPASGFSVRSLSLALGHNIVKENSVLPKTRCLTYSHNLHTHICIEVRTILNIKKHCRTKKSIRDSLQMGTS